MVMSSTTLVPVEEYLRMTEKPYCEYRDGVLYPKAMATTFHGILEPMLGFAIRKLGLQAAVEVTVRLSPTKYLVPDVIAAKVLQSPYPTEPVLLCCEIPSPEDGLGATLAKCEEYHAAGEPLRVTGTLHAGEFSVSLEELFLALDTPLAGV
jgi:Uma2 family endonuclease